MNVTRTQLTDYVAQTRQAIHDKRAGGGSELLQKVTGERLEDIAEFSSKLEQTPGQDVEQILATSESRGGTGLQRGLLVTGLIVGVSAVFVAPFLAISGEIAPALAALTGVGGAATAGLSGYKLDRFLAEDRFQNTLTAFAQDSQSLPPGLLSGFRSQASSGDDGWIANPANPGSPNYIL